MLRSDRAVVIAKRLLIVLIGVGLAVGLIVRYDNGAPDNGSPARKQVESSPGGSGCTTIVTSVDRVDRSIAPGTVVCLAAASPGRWRDDGAMSLTGSGTSRSPATVEALPGDHVTLSTIAIQGSYLTIAGFYVVGAPSNTGGVIFEAGATHDALEHNDVSETAAHACGQAVRLLGANGGTHVSFITIAHNRIHDTGTSCEGDAIYMQGWDHVVVTANDIYNLKADSRLCSGNCHQDTLQSYLAGIPTLDLTVTRNYVHDNLDTQGLAFLADGDISSGLVLDQNLETRVTTTGPPTGMQLGINSVGMRIEHNTYWGGTHSNLTAVGSTPNPSVLLDHNLFDDFEMEDNGHGHLYPSLSDFDNIFGSAPWSWRPSVTDQIDPNPSFMCSTGGGGGSNICGNGTPAGDDYRLTPNPDGIGIDWAPATQSYGP